MALLGLCLVVFMVVTRDAIAEASVQSAENLGHPRGRHAAHHKDTAADELRALQERITRQKHKAAAGHAIAGEQGEVDQMMHQLKLLNAQATAQAEKIERLNSQVQTLQAAEKQLAEMIDKGGQSHKEDRQSHERVAKALQSAHVTKIKARETLEKARRKHEAHIIHRNKVAEAIKERLPHHSGRGGRRVQHRAASVIEVDARGGHIAMDNLAGHEEKEDQQEEERAEEEEEEREEEEEEEDRKEDEAAGRLRATGYDFSRQQRDGRQRREEEPGEEDELNEQVREMASWEEESEHPARRDLEGPFTPHAWKLNDDAAIAESNAHARGLAYQGGDALGRDLQHLSFEEQAQKVLQDMAQHPPDPPGEQARSQARFAETLPTGDALTGPPREALEDMPAEDQLGGPQSVAPRNVVMVGSGMRREKRRDGGEKLTPKDIAAVVNIVEQEEELARESGQNLAAPMVQSRIVEEAVRAVQRSQLGSGASASQDDLAGQP